MTTDRLKEVLILHHKLVKTFNAKSGEEFLQIFQAASRYMALKYQQRPSCSVREEA